MPEKHEIYAATFGGDLFYDLFSQGQGNHGPLGPPGSATDEPHFKQKAFEWNANRLLANSPGYIVNKFEYVRGLGQDLELEEGSLYGEGGVRAVEV